MASDATIGGDKILKYHQRSEIKLCHFTHFRNDILWLCLHSNDSNGKVKRKNKKNEANVGLHNGINVIT